MFFLKHVSGDIEPNFSLELVAIELCGYVKQLCVYSVNGCNGATVIS